MATNYYNAQIGVVDASGNVNVIYPITKATNVDVTSANYGGSSATTVLQTALDNLSSALSGKAPTFHSSSATTYGKGTSSAYGHLKIVDDIIGSGYPNTSQKATNGVAISAWGIQNWVNNHNSMFHNGLYSVYKANLKTNLGKNGVIPAKTCKGSSAFTTSTLYSDCGYGFQDNVSASGFTTTGALVIPLENTFPVNYSNDNATVLFIINGLSFNSNSSRSSINCAGYFINLSDTAYTLTNNLYFTVRFITLNGVSISYSTSIPAIHGN